MPKMMDAVAHQYYIAVYIRMSNKSKIKGKSWERDVANFLTKLYNEPFLRVPNSGAFVGGYNIYRTQTMTEQQVKSFKGDIIPCLLYTSPSPRDATISRLAGWG